VIVAVVAVVVVVLVVVAMLALHGRSSAAVSVEPYPPVHCSPSDVCGTPLLYSQIDGPAAAAQALQPGAPWTLEAALGVGENQSVTGVGGLVTGCTEPWVNSSVITLPATPSNASAGKLSIWLVASDNSSGDVLLTYVTDISGSITASNGVVLYGSCTTDFTLGAIPSSVVDSSLVATSADGLGGTSFLESHSGITTIVGIEASVWEVQYTTCSLFDPTGNGQLFVALFYATNGTLVPGAEGTLSEPCS